MINFTSALEMLKTVRNSANHLNDATLKQHLLDLQGHLLNLQVQVLEQQVDNRGLQNEVVRLRECLATERRLERVFDAYMVVESANKKRGPFCVTCWKKATDAAGVSGSWRWNGLLAPRARRKRELRRKLKRRLARRRSSRRLRILRHCPAHSPGLISAFGTDLATYRMFAAKEGWPRG